jgi:chemotaxis signal transduction protein
MVCFRTSQGQFALPVESTLAVRTMDGLVDLPAPRADIVGLLPGDPPLSVLSTLGAGGDHVLVVISDDVRYGLNVLEVLGVRRFEDDEVGPPPKGQQGGLIAGTLHGSDELVLVADARALAGRL